MPVRAIIHYHWSDLFDLPTRGRITRTPLDEPSGSRRNIHSVDKLILRFASPPTPDRRLDLTSDYGSRGKNLA